MSESNIHQMSSMIKKMAVLFEKRCSLNQAAMMLIRRVANIPCSACDGHWLTMLEEEMIVLKRSLEQDVYQHGLKVAATGSDR